MKEYVVIYEDAGPNWSAYAPDVPGCVSTGKTWEECERNFREALAAHLELMRESGEEIPEPATKAGVVAVAA